MDKTFLKFVAAAYPEGGWCDCCEGFSRSLHDGLCAGCHTAGLQRERDVAVGALEHLEVFYRTDLLQVSPTEAVAPEEIVRVALEGIRESGNDQSQGRGGDREADERRG